MIKISTIKHVIITVPNYTNVYHIRVRIKFVMNRILIREKTRINLTLTVFHYVLNH